MKEGAWIEAATGRWHWIDEHALWIRRPENAHRVGFSEDLVRELSVMPYNLKDGEERWAILLKAMNAGLIRARGHGDHLTIEGTVSPNELRQGARAFLEQVCGPCTQIKVNQLPDGPCIAGSFDELCRRSTVAEPERA